MHIIIPMSGVGRRFQEAGYTQPKPLISVDGMPMIEHVVGLFPALAKQPVRFSFICNETHLAETPLAETLRRICPAGEIVAIAPHKLGPVHAVLQWARQQPEAIDPEEPVVVNYCDFSTRWSFEQFVAAVGQQQAAGSVVAYRGFHPHMLGTDHYAFIREQDGWLQAIQEKQPFTNNRMAEFASNGTYYFARGEWMLKYFRQLMDEGQALNGEYYVSMVYNLMVRDGLPVSVYEVDTMLQWGTPKDLREYQAWSDLFRSLMTPPTPPEVEPGSMTLIPMAGRGERFRQEHYALPKPLIPVNNRPMVVEAIAALPPSEALRLVCLADHLEDERFQQAIAQDLPNATLMALEQVTEGQACTCAVGLEGVSDDTPVFIGACDNGLLYNAQAYQALRDDPTVDAIAFSVVNHPSAVRQPQMYGWMSVDEQATVSRVSVKQPVSATPEKDHAIVGAFYFRRAGDFREALAILQANNQRVNGEFYVDSLLDVLLRSGKTVKAFAVEHYIGWGTPNDLKVYEYWQRFFHACEWHPYRQTIHQAAHLAEAAAFTGPGPVHSNTQTLSQQSVVLH
ncbi:MAG: NTP transferase domain-containing protein [Candidatus Melainabacteria bacterium]|nr:NTP transferase domain-containing protein [Candidatus Melainabacteria bacterium]